MTCPYFIKLSVLSVTKENRISDQFIIRFITSLGNYKSHQGVIHEGVCPFMNRHSYPLVHINIMIQTINQYNNSFPQSFLSFTLTIAHRSDDEAHSSVPCHAHVPVRSSSDHGRPCTEPRTKEATARRAKGGWAGSYRGLLAALFGFISQMTT